MTRLRDRAGRLVETHGHSKRRSPEYVAWATMLQRCNNPKASGYVNYGGRGIRVCARWATFEHFLADVGPRPEGKYSLDRINNERDYEPGNCRWATKQEQQRNRRASRLNPEKVRQIREMVSLGKTYKEIAKSFGICAAYVSDIAHRRYWADVL